MTLPFLFPPFFGFGFVFYFFPSIIALARSKRNTLPIFISEPLPRLDAGGMGHRPGVGGESGQLSGPGSLGEELFSPLFRECCLKVVDFCRRIRQINTSASSTVRSAKSNPREALQTC